MKRNQRSGPPLVQKKGIFFNDNAYIYLSGWMCVGAETAPMIHELLSTTVCFYQSSFKSLYLSLSISRAKIDRSLGLWVEGHVDSRLLMDPQIFEVKVS